MDKQKFSKKVEGVSKIEKSTSTSDIFPSGLKKSIQPET